MHIDAALAIGLGGAAAAARAAEDAGYDGVWTTETRHDPFLPLVVAAEHTERVQLGTAAALALVRNPMSLATTAYDLHACSGGRFVLGLGSQVREHVERRFGMEWSRPVERMREFVVALRAIWHSWNSGDALDFRGDFYTHTLMPPFFNPGPNPFGSPRVFLAGVGARMTEVAGEVADGFLCHGFSTPDHFRSVTLPALSRGLARSGRTLADIEISAPSLIVTGNNEEEMARAATAVRQQIAFYGSMAAHRGVLDHHGWEALHDDLRAAARDAAWNRMTNLVDDDVLRTFAVVAPPDDVGAELYARYGEYVQRITLDAPYAVDPATWRETIDVIRSGFEDAQLAAA